MAFVQDFSILIVRFSLFFVAGLFNSFLKNGEQEAGNSVQKRSYELIRYGCRSGVKIFILVQFRWVKGLFWIKQQCELI
jgi:hypothetical protein